MDITNRGNFYVGETNKMLREGFGVYLYENKFFKYEGEWQNGKKHGHGRLAMTDGSFYEGEFQNGEIYGKGERFWSKSGNLYRGEFKNGEMNGTGIMFYGNGDEYHGEWNLNVREGNGNLSYANGNVYEGEFYKHKIHGEGTFRYIDGSSYTGYWVCGNKQGHGKMVLSDGSVYEGQFNHNMFHGEGILSHISGTIYNGIWEQDLPCKIPRKMQLNGNILDCFQSNTFTFSLSILTDTDEVVHEESGRKLKVTAGIKYEPLKENNSLFELIEQMQVQIIETPYYPVLLVPLTSNPPQWIIDLEQSRRENLQTPSLLQSPDIDNLQSTELANEDSDRITVSDDPCTHCVIKEIQNGFCEFSNLFIQKADKSLTPYLLSDQESGVLTSSTQRKTSISSSSKQNIKDQPITEDSNSKHKRFGDERFTRPGEYIIIVEDITENPYMSILLEPIYTKMQIHPFSVPNSLEVSNSKDSHKRRSSQWDANKQVSKANIRKHNSRRSSFLI